VALTAATVINHARDLHPSLSPVNAPNALACRALSRFLSELVEKIARRVPGYLGTTLTVPLPLAVFTAGIDLTAAIPGGWKRLLDGFFVYSASQTNPPTRVRANPIPYEQRDMNGPLPAWTFLANTVTFLGQETDYSQFSSFLLTYTPLAVDVANVGSAIPLPDDSREALAAMLAAFFLKRLVDDPQYRVSAKTATLYQGDADTEKAQFLRRIWRLTQNQDYVIRDVMSGR
jgi:hypothetical protein